MSSAYDDEIKARLAEVERDRDRADKWCSTEALEERDHREALLDRFADEMGDDTEHSNLNCRWTNAFDLLGRLQARAEKAEADLAAEREARQRAEADLRARLASIVGAIGGFDYEGHPVGTHNYLQRLRILVAAEAQVAGLAAALWDIANDPHISYDHPANGGGQYGIGVADGHRCAAEKARAALTDARPALAAHVERETAALRAQRDAARRERDELTEDFGEQVKVLRQERDQLAAAATRARLHVANGEGLCMCGSDSDPDRHDHPIKTHGQHAVEILDAALAGSGEALRERDARVRREALEEAYRAVVSCIQHPSAEERGALTMARHTIRALLDAKKEADRE